MTEQSETPKKNKNPLSKEISFQKKSVYPTKTSINFIADDQQKKDKKAVMLFVVFLLVLAVFVKLAVIDPLNKISSLEKQYNDTETLIEQYQTANADYSDIKAKYDSLSGSFMTDDEKSHMNRMDMIQMLEDDLINDVPVQSVQITGSSISVHTGSTTLPVVSDLLAKMQNDSRNSYVTVTTTSASGASDSAMVTADFEIVYAGGTE